MAVPLAEHGLLIRRGYLELAGLAEGCLVMLDLRRETSWQDKLTVRDASCAGKPIRIFGG